MKKLFLMMLIGLGCVAVFAQSHGAKKFAQRHHGSSPKKDTAAATLAVPVSRNRNIGADLIYNGNFGTPGAPDLTGWTPQTCEIESTIFGYNNVAAKIFNRTKSDSCITQDITTALNANGGGYYLFEAWFTRSEDPDILKTLYLSVTQSVKNGPLVRSYVFSVYDSYIQSAISAPGGSTPVTIVKGLVELKDGCRNAYVQIRPGATLQEFIVDRISLRKLEPDWSYIPFPRKSPGIILDPRDQNNVICIYDQWKARYLKTLTTDPNGMYVGQTQYFDWDYVEDGKDIHVPPQDQYKPRFRSDAIATSEGMGYGLLISVMMAGYDGDAKKNFDALLYTVEKFKATEGAQNTKLMSWVVPADEIPAHGSDTATDGDLDIAYSLILAYEQFGDVGYLDKAKVRINAIKLAYVMNSDNINFNGLLKIGNWQDNTQTFSRPSDWLLDHFKAFKAIAGIDFDSTINFIYRAINGENGTLSYLTGLLPDFTEGYTVTVLPADCLTYYYVYVNPDFSKNGTLCEIESKNDGKYFYNACRVPWRFAVDFLHTQNLKTKDQLWKIMEFFKNTAPDQVNCGYELIDGVPLPVLGDASYPPENEDHDGEYETGSLTFVAPIAAAYAVYTRRYDPNRYRDQYQAYWNYIKNGFEDDYFADSINLLCMLTVTGNWWDPGIAPNKSHFK